MKLIVARSLWGISEPWDVCFPKIKAAGYAAIEQWAPQDAARFRAALDAQGLSYIAMVSSEGNGVDEHLKAYRANLENAKKLKPIGITSQSGSDAWSFQDSKRFFAEATRIERDLGVTVGHETHRRRVLYNPWIARDLVFAVPDMKLCLDLSHWVVVTERLLDDTIDIVRTCADRAVHIHARVGYEHGPQVPDPRAPEYHGHVVAYESWWDMVWDAQARMGAEFSTLTPEFGPPDYMHTLPYTRVPVADLWDICLWQAQRQAERFAKRAQTAAAKR